MAEGRLLLSSPTRRREEQTLKELLVTQKQLGLNIDWLDKKEMLEVIPDLNPNGLIGGTYLARRRPRLAAPRRARVLYVMPGGPAPSSGSTSESPASSSRAGASAASKRTGRNTAPSVVINAAGAWAAEVGEIAGIDVPVRPDSHEGAVTEPVAHFLKPMVVDIHPTDASANYYFFQHATGQVIFCITPNPSIWGFDTRETSSFLPMVARRMVDIMPRLKNIRVRRTWRGLYPMTPDGAPLVGWARGSRRAAARGRHVRPGIHDRSGPRRDARPSHQGRPFGGDREILESLALP